MHFMTHCEVMCTWPLLLRAKVSKQISCSTISVLISPQSTIVLEKPQHWTDLNDFSLQLFASLICIHRHHYEVYIRQKSIVTITTLKLKKEEKTWNCSKHTHTHTSNLNGVFSIWKSVCAPNLIISTIWLYCKILILILCNSPFICLSLSHAHDLHTNDSTYRSAFCIIRQSNVRCVPSL